MNSSDTPIRLEAADEFRETVLIAKKNLREVKLTACNRSNNYTSVCETLDNLNSRLSELKSGRGKLLDQIESAKIYEFWFEFPGYSGPNKGAAARLTEHGAIQQVSNVSGGTKGGLGGAAVGGLIFGPAGAIVGSVVGRKTTVKTDIQTVDNRKFELELGVPGFFWSTIAGPGAEASFRRFRDIVNARGTSPDDIKLLTAEQEEFVKREREHEASAKNSLTSAEKIVEQENSNYNEIWNKYKKLRLPILEDLKARWNRSGPIQKFFVITLGPIMMLALAICFLLSIMFPASVLKQLVFILLFIQIVILVSAAYTYIVKVRLLK